MSVDGAVDRPLLCAQTGELIGPSRHLARARPPQMLAAVRPLLAFCPDPYRLLPMRVEGSLLKNLVVKKALQALASTLPLIVSRRPSCAQLEDSLL